MASRTTSENETYSFHPLDQKYKLWYHDNDNQDWSIDSYKELMLIETIEDYWMTYEKMSNKIINNTMLFLMKEGVLPTWEDPQNINGGCISIKLPFKEASKLWQELVIYMIASKLEGNVLGISISPKKSFNIIKIWVPEEIEDIKTYKFPESFNLDNKLILFRIHKTNIEKDKLKK